MAVTQTSTYLRVGYGADAKKPTAAAAQDGLLYFTTDSAASAKKLYVYMNGTSWSIYDTTYSAATQSAAGLMSAADKKKLDGIATGAQTGTVTSIATSNGVTGGTITTTGTISLALVNASAVLTNAGTATTTTQVANRTYALQLDSNNQLAVYVPWANTTYSVATTTAAGLLPTLSGTATTYLNGNGEWATPPDTKNTVGSTDTNSKIFLVGTTSQTASAQSYSHDTAYVGTDGCLYSGGTKVLTSHQSLAAYAKLASPALTGTPTAPTATAGTNTTQIATTEFVTTAVSNSFAAQDAMRFKGTIEGGSTGAYGALTAAATTGDTYKVSKAGKINGIAVEVGDMLICTADNTAAATTSNYSTVAANWVVVQSNIDGAVTGPASATDGAFALFDGTTGKIIKNSSYTPSSFAAASHGTHVTYGTSATAVSSTAAAGSASTVSRSDHVHSISVATGDSNGQVKIAGQNATVKGINTAAYVASGSFLGSVSASANTTNKTVVWQKTAYGGSASTYVTWTSLIASTNGLKIAKLTVGSTDIDVYSAIAWESFT